MGGPWGGGQPCRWLGRHCPEAGCRHSGRPGGGLSAERRPVTLGQRRRLESQGQLGSSDLRPQHFHVKSETRGEMQGPHPRCQTPQRCWSLCPPPAPPPPRDYRVDARPQTGEVSKERPATHLPGERWAWGGQEQALTPRLRPPGRGQEPHPCEQKRPPPRGPGCSAARS